MEKIYTGTQLGGKQLRAPRVREIRNAPRLPHAFIGSSKESLEIATTIQEILQEDVVSRVWTDDVFKPGQFSLESLLNVIDDFSYAIFVFSPEDIAIIRDQQFMVVRDNLIFEYGMFVSKLGRERTFFLTPKNTDGVHLPSDFEGLEPVKIQYQTNDLVTSLSPACNLIRRRIKELEAEGKHIIFSREQYRLFLKAKRSLILEAQSFFRNDIAVPTLLALDIDNFALINNSYSQKTTDMLKKEFNKILDEFLLLRFEHMTNKYYLDNLGSDEFYIFFDGLLNSEKLASEILSLISEHNWDNIAKGCQMTCSAGIAHYDKHHNESIEKLMVRALSATKLSKAKGGNQVSSADIAIVETYKFDLFYMTS